MNFNESSKHENETVKGMNFSNLTKILKKKDYNQEMKILSHNSSRSEIKFETESDNNIIQNEKIFKNFNIENNKILLIGNETEEEIKNDLLSLTKKENLENEKIFSLEELKKIKNNFLKIEKKNFLKNYSDEYLYELKEISKVLNLFLKEAEK